MLTPVVIEVRRSGEAKIVVPKRSNTSRPEFKPTTLNHVDQRSLVKLSLRVKP